MSVLFRIQEIIRAGDEGDAIAAHVSHLFIGNPQSGGAVAPQPEGVEVET